MSGRKWNSVTYVSRPPANRKGARIAWDILSYRDDNRTPEAMWYVHMDYWVWVMKFTDGEYDEVDGLVVSCQANRKYRKEQRK